MSVLETWDQSAGHQWTRVSLALRFANAVTRNAVKGEVQEEEKGEDPKNK